MESSKSGHAITSHLGRPVAPAISNEQGSFVFDRVAECNEDGCPLDQLQSDEIMIHPGLIYRQAS